MSEVTVKARHTPGPWKAFRYQPGDRWGVQSVSNESAAVIVAPIDGEDEVTEEANARLIAQAPNLLALAKRILNDIAWGDLPGEDLFLSDGRRIEDALTEAIDAAEGKP